MLSSSKQEAALQILPPSFAFVHDAAAHTAFPPRMDWCVRGEETRGSFNMDGLFGLHETAGKAVLDQHFQ